MTTDGVNRKPSPERSLSATDHQARWRPIITAGAEPYVAAIDAIAKDLGTMAAERPDWGATLIHAYLGLARNSAAHGARAKELLDQQVALLATRVRRYSLYEGVAGTGWLVAHLDALADSHDRTSQTDYADVDEAIRQYCISQRPPYTYDLISGLVGIGVYCLERLPDSVASQSLKIIADKLTDSAEVREGRCAWHTPAFLLPQYQRAQLPRGYYNLGVAHGVPGIIGLLARIQASAIGDATSRTLLSGAMKWVLQQRLPSGLFPNWNESYDEPGPPARLSWCYGELGLSITLLVGARALGDRTIEDQALQIALSACGRRTDAGVRDATLCHGAAGNAHLFNRLYQMTDREEFVKASHYWFSEALSMRSPGVGVGGYRSWQSGRQAAKDGPWLSDPSFLGGAAGIALAFLAAVSAVEPRWDVVLLSCP